MKLIYNSFFFEGGDTSKSLFQCSGAVVKNSIEQMEKKKRKKKEEFEHSSNYTCDD